MAAKDTFGQPADAEQIATIPSTATRKSKTHQESIVTVEAAITPRAARAGTETAQEVALTAARRTYILLPPIAETVQPLAQTPTEALAAPLVPVCLLATTDLVTVITIQ